ncbi:ubiquitin-associated protein 1-like [Eublepharis macularius]|uniref:Ubiquitin-associated protein 1-like n=1 Tax=Eublepharis macularius TaxID=481883 RepID=A0AA97KJJ1_EUBMA|nr:ubiquitin-associated protein 1-like [Eublepharis macularius]
MSYLDDVPFKVTTNVVDDSVGEAHLVQAPEFEMPNCTEILIYTMHDFSLEKKVLYWIESASRQDTPWYEVTTDVVPTAPPCWLLLVDSKESSPKATGIRMQDVSPVRRCVSLDGEDEGQRIARVNRDCCSEEDEDSTGEGPSSATSTESNLEECPVSDAGHVPSHLPRFLSPPQQRPQTSPVPSTAPFEGSCPKPALLKQSRSLLLFNNVKNELERVKGKLAAFVNQSLTEPSLASRAFSLHQRSRNSRKLRYRSASDASLVGTLRPTPPSTPCCSPRPRSSAGLIPPIQKHKPTVASLSPYSCLPPPPGAQQSLGSHRSHPDSTADLLEALSQEERDLIEPVLALGYPIRRAILALQKTGRQSLGQFLSYLSACDKLLKQGYEEAEVEEAMEMFQNSEKVAAEYLHLLAQFNDMGFQQADIKEVLLLCENQGDNALEELMTRTL